MVDKEAVLELGAPPRVHVAHEPRLDERDIDTFWTTREGEFMKMSEMKYSHLCNSLRMVRRGFSIDRYQRSCPPFPMFNGEMAQMFAEQDWGREMERRSTATSIVDYPKFVGLAREHTKRVIQLRRTVRGMDDSVSFT